MKIENFTFFMPILIPLDAFSCLIALFPRQRHMETERVCFVSFLNCAASLWGSLICKRLDLRFLSPVFFFCLLSQH